MGAWPGPPSPVRWGLQSTPEEEWRARLGSGEVEVVMVDWECSDTLQAGEHSGEMAVAFLHSAERGWRRSGLRARRNKGEPAVSVDLTKVHRMKAKLKVYVLWPGERLLVV